MGAHQFVLPLVFHVLVFSRNITWSFWWHIVVPIGVVASFRRMKKLVQDRAIIEAALRTSLKLVIHCIAISRFSMFNWNAGTIAFFASLDIWAIIVFFCSSRLWAQTGKGSGGYTRCHTLNWKIQRWQNCWLPFFWRKTDFLLKKEIDQPRSLMALN
jgi:hypothetical protein